MLKELIVNNIVLIEILNVKFKKGLSVLTGETGTGKSILLDSLGLIVGNRVDFNLIRNGENEASVTAIFEINHSHPVNSVLEKYNIKNEDELIIRRLINVDGKSRCFINDVLVTRNVLIEVTDYLIEMQGQFQERGLLDVKTHLSLLDTFCNHNDLLNATKISYDKMKELRKIIKETEILQKNFNEEIEWIQESFNQLNVLDPKFSEEESLDQQKKTLLNNEKIFISINQTKSLLEEENGLEDLNYKIIKSLQGIENFGLTNINSAIEISDTIKVQLEELKSLLNNEITFTNETKYNLEEIEDRLYELRSQARKHNCKVDDLINIKEQLESKLQTADNHKHKLKTLKNKFNDVTQQYVNASSALSESRKKNALKLANKINAELPHLKLDHASFQVKFKDLDIDNATSEGVDSVIFLVSTNTGIDPLPINKVASGGELSRFLLAIKVVLESALFNRTIIFDEIDSGIGGFAANAVGIKLSTMGKAYQTMVVTHSPQVTAKGDHHYLVQKIEKNNKTITNVLKLNNDQRIEEIARMLSGSSITDEARKAASQLLNNN